LGGENVEREILDRLVRVEAKQDLQLNQCAPCRTKVDEHGLILARLEASAKSAHHRLDTAKEDNKEQVAGIYRTAALIGGVAGFLIGIIVAIVNKH
jgi:hypothetical protein